MEKELRTHYQQTLEQIERFEKSKLTDDDSPRLRRQVRVLYRTHVARVHDFQHERLIHLLVTFFFGFLFLVTLFALFAIQLTSLSTSTILTILSVILAAILLIVELFYIRHYYQLENGVQRLYKLTDRLQKLLV